MLTFKAPFRSSCCRAPWGSGRQRIWVDHRLLRERQGEEEREGKREKEKGKREKTVQPSLVPQSSGWLWAFPRAWLCCMISSGHACWSTVTFPSQARPRLPWTAKALPRPLQGGDEQVLSRMHQPVPPPPVPGDILSHLLRSLPSSDTFPPATWAAGSSPPVTLLLVTSPQQPGRLVLGGQGFGQQLTSLHPTRPNPSPGGTVLHKETSPARCSVGFESLVPVGGTSSWSLLVFNMGSFSSVF